LSSQIEFRPKIIVILSSKATFQEFEPSTINKIIIDLNKKLCFFAVLMLGMILSWLNLCHKENSALDKPAFENVSQKISCNTVIKKALDLSL